MTESKPGFVLKYVYPSLQDLLDHQKDNSHKESLLHHYIYSVYQVLFFICSPWKYKHFYVIWLHK